MTKIAVAFATAGLLLAMPTFNGSAAADPKIQLAQADVRIGVGDGGARVRIGDRPRSERVIIHRDRPGYRAYARDRDCSRTVVIKDGRKTVIKRCR